MTLEIAIFDGDPLRNIQKPWKIMENHGKSGFLMS